MNPTALAVAPDPCAQLASSADCVGFLLFQPSFFSEGVRPSTAVVSEEVPSDMDIRRRKLDACSPHVGLRCEGEARDGESAAWLCQNIARMRPGS